MISLAISISKSIVSLLIILVIHLHSKKYRLLDTLYNIFFIKSWFQWLECYPNLSHAYTSVVSTPTTVLGATTVTRAPVWMARCSVVASGVGRQTASITPTRRGRPSHAAHMRPASPAATRSASLRPACPGAPATPWTKYPRSSTQGSTPTACQTLPLSTITVSNSHWCLTSLKCLQ